ncbi:MAG: lipocalin-like domain-containing protein [Longimicrobiales bacterium]
MRSFGFALGLFASVAASGLEAQSPLPGLDGAWRVVEVEITGPGARTVESPQPGLLLFTGRHYSYTFVTSDGPRPSLAGPATAEDLATVWNPFTANAGTFEVSGSVMFRRPLVAKSPDAMATGAFNQYSFRLSADTLWMTTTATEAGPVRNPSTVRYARVR